MEKSALKLADEEPATFVDSRPVQQEPPSSIVTYSCVAGVVLTDEKQFSNRASKRRRRLARFLKLETIALLFLVLTVAGASSQRIRETDLTMAFQITMVPAALAVALIPVIFYGPTRQKYRYSARR
jgi:hypothetical protein